MYRTLLLSQLLGAAAQGEPCTSGAQEGVCTNYQNSLRCYFDPAFEIANHPVGRG